MFAFILLRLSRNRISALLARARPSRRYRTRIRLAHGRARRGRDASTRVSSRVILGSFRSTFFLFPCVSFRSTVHAVSALRNIEIRLRNTCAARPISDRASSPVTPRTNAARSAVSRYYSTDIIRCDRTDRIIVHYRENDVRRWAGGHVAACVYTVDGYYSDGGSSRAAQSSSKTALGTQNRISRGSVATIRVFVV